MSEFEEWWNTLLYSNNENMKYAAEKAWRKSRIAALKCVQQKSFELIDITYLQQWLVKKIEELESGKVW
jgi:hypothetical protein